MKDFSQICNHKKSFKSPTKTWYYIYLYCSFNVIKRDKIDDCIRSMFLWYLTVENLFLFFHSNDISTKNRKVQSVLMANRLYSGLDSTPQNLNTPKVGILFVKLILVICFEQGSSKKKLQIETSEFKSDDPSSNSSSSPYRPPGSPPSDVTSPSPGQLNRTRRRLSVISDNKVCWADCSFS